MAISFLCAMLVSGCGGVSKDADYETINDLGADYESATGVECSESGNDVADHGWNQTTCGPAAIIMLFTSDDKREEVKQSNPLESGQRWVQGGNWLIEADQFDAEKAHEALGGELLDG